MDFIRGKVHGCADRVVSSIFDIGEVNVPVVLMFVADHGKHLRHGVVDKFNDTPT